MSMSEGWSSAAGTGGGGASSVVYKRAAVPAIKHLCAGMASGAFDEKLFKDLFSTVLSANRA